MAIFPDITPAYPFNRKPMFVVDVVGYENQKEQRLLRTSSPRYSYTANWVALTTAEKKLIQDFFIARQGNFEAFSYIDRDPDSLTFGQSLSVRFVEAAHNFDYFSFQLWHFARVEMIDAV